MTRVTQRDTQDHWVTRLLRFVCGALFGLVFGFYIAARDVRDGVIAVAVITAVSLTCGWLSERYGMDFWEALGRLRWWA